MDVTSSVHVRFISHPLIYIHQISLEIARKIVDLDSTIMPKIIQELQLEPKSETKDWMSAFLLCSCTIDMIIHRHLLLLSFHLGEVLGFESVVFHMFDFIHALVESSKFKDVVKTHLEQLLYFLLVYMEITEDQVG